MRTPLGKVSPLLCALMAADAAGPIAAPGAARSNHLKGSSSPYLQRASQQPIDWYPWGEEAFKKAKDLDRPILLDLGAEWCPYCAQMDRESYSQPELATFINDQFVAVKVDYDWQPEIAARLQRAQAFMKGRTALLDAIYLGLSEMRGAHSGKRALLIISDGATIVAATTRKISSSWFERPIHSSILLASLTRLSIAAEHRKTQWAIAAQRNERINRWARFQRGNLNELPDIAAKIGMELRNQYVLGYHPSHKTHDGRWRKIKIKLRAPKGLPPLNICAKTGYYAPNL